MTNGIVNSIVSNDSTVYIGGSFSLVGPSVPYGIPLDSTTGLPNMAYPVPNGPVWAVVPDGKGGWYIGGEFASVGGQARNRLARINSDGTLHAWDPNANGSVYTLAVSGSRVYVGGAFNGANSINGNTCRNRLAAVDTGTGLVTHWNPNAGATVNTLAVGGGKAYVGGSFNGANSINGNAYRNRLAAVDTDSGKVTSWDPSAGGIVNTIAINGDTLHVGGSFTTVNSTSTPTTTRNRIAAYNLVTGNLLAWNPAASGGAVNCIVVVDSTVYVGGLFTTIGGSSRSKIAALKARVNSSYATAWNPNADSDVNSLKFIGARIYAGGKFQKIGGKLRPCIAALDTATGMATSWDPKAGNVVRAFAEYSGTIYTGGDFTVMGGEARNRLAAIDTSTGKANAWNPDADNTVHTLLLSGGLLYAGGIFTMVDSVTRNKLAAIDPVTAEVRSWDPDAYNNVFSLAASGDTIYAGGNFTSIGLVARNRIAAISADSGKAIATWNANVSGKVNAIAVSGGKVYFGGDFTGANTVNGNKTRRYLAAVNSSNGTVVDSWNPQVDSCLNCQVFAVAVYNGLVHVAGDFISFRSSGYPRNRLAALDPSNAIPTGWNPNSSGTISAMAFRGAMVYVGRGFTSIGGSARQNAAGIYLNVNTNNAAPWFPKTESFVYGIAVCRNKLFLGGLSPGWMVCTGTVSRSIPSPLSTGGGCRRKFQ